MHALMYSSRHNEANMGARMLGVIFAAIVLNFSSGALLSVLRISYSFAFCCFYDLTFDFECCLLDVDI